MAGRLLNSSNNDRSKTSKRKEQPKKVIVLLIIISFLFCVTQFHGSKITSIYGPYSLYNNYSFSSISMWDTTAATAATTATTTTTTTTTTTATTTTTKDGHDDDDDDDDDGNLNLATKILLGEKSLLSSDETTNKSTELKFVPGSLKTLNSKDTLKFCYTNPIVYKKHLHAAIMVTISDSYKLIYRHLPKSGSSTARTILGKHFHSHTQQINFGVNRDLQINYTKFNHKNDPILINQTNHHISYYTNYTSFTFIRDPLSRFFSGYDEAYHRDAPWHGKARGNNNGPNYLYEGIKNNKEYMKLQQQKRKQQNQHNNSTTKEKNGNGTTTIIASLEERLERYVQETDRLLNPFDTHLRLQVPLLTNHKTGLTIRLDEIYNLHDVDKAFQHMYNFMSNDNDDDDGLNNMSSESEFRGGRTARARARARTRSINLNDYDNNDNNNGLKMMNFSKFHGRARSRSIDLNLISNETKQRICEFSLLDYCCLNMPLPPPCTNLFCKLSYYDNHNHEQGDQGQQDSDNNNNNSSKNRRLQYIIQPWSFPSSTN